MFPRRRTLKLAALLTLVAFMLVGTIPSLVQAGNPNPNVLPPESAPYGRTYGEWSAAWWQWGYSLPVSTGGITTHPLFVNGNIDCSYGQSGRVWFLGGTYSVTANPDNTYVGIATRSCTIPAGTALFFPILNYEADNFWPPRDSPLTEEELREDAKKNMDSVTELSAEIDGVALQDLSRYRATSPAFAVTLPENNIPQYFELTAPAGQYSPLVADGYYLMLAPLSIGQHTIHFRGAVPGFALDITYHITVTD